MNNNTSYVRLLHASPNAPAVDVFANGNLIGDDLRFGEFTNYLPIPPAEYQIEIFPAMGPKQSVLSEEIIIPDNTILTVAVIGELPNIELYAIVDPKEQLSLNMTGLRFVHLSPNAPPVDIRLPNGTILFDDVSYREVTDYLEVPPRTYTVEVVPTGTDNVVLYVPNINLMGNRFYTVYAVGLVNDEPELQVLIPLDGNSYINV